jgi:hypothetical protein
MRRPRTSPRLTVAAPPPLAHVLRAAERECPRGHARALADLADLATRKVPSRGIFDPAVRSEHDLFAAIEAIADAHLNYGNARTALRVALDAAGLPLERRDDLERAMLELQSVSDTAYFYAGLAFGLVSMSVYGRS